MPDTNIPATGEGSPAATSSPAVEGVTNTPGDKSIADTRTDMQKAIDDQAKSSDSTKIDANLYKIDKYKELKVYDVEMQNISVNDIFFKNQTKAAGIAALSDVSTKVTGDPYTLETLTFRPPVKAFFSVTGPDNNFTFENFILEAYSVAESTVTALHETFSTNYATVFGENPTIYKLTGTVYDIYSHDWMRNFYDTYINKLRATCLLLNKSSAFLQVDHIVIEGYPLDIQISKVSANPHSAKFSMSFLEIGRSSNRGGLEKLPTYYDNLGPDKTKGANFEFREPTKAFVYITGDKDGPVKSEKYDRLIIEAYQLQESERYNVIKTFSANFFAFYGARPSTYSISGTTLDTASHDWMLDLHNFYNQKLCMKQLVNNKMKMCLFVDDVVMEGYPISFSYNKSSTDPMASKFQMAFIKTDIYFNDTTLAKRKAAKPLFSSAPPAIFGVIT